jgi:hypothetical protein
MAKIAYKKSLMDTNITILALLSATPRLQYYDVQTLEYRYIAHVVHVYI